MIKLFYDSLAIIVFFILYYVFNIYIATLGAMITSLGQVTLVLFKRKRPDTTQLVSLIAIFLLGGATLIFKNEMFIKWKPTAVYWALAIAFLGSQFIGKKSFIKRMLENTIELPAPIWPILNMSWAAFFFSMGILNLLIVYNFSTQIWVNFKLFGVLGLTLVFVIVQGVCLSRYILKPKVQNLK